MPKRFKTFRRLAQSASLCVFLAAASPSVADSLQRGNLPVIQGVTLIGVEDGKLKYRTAAGDRDVPLKEISTLTIDSVPKFAEGIKALDEGKLRSAQRAFEDVWADANIEWVKHFGGFYLVQVYDQRGEAVEAAQVYARLAAANADVFFLSKPPVASLAEADENQKERIGNEIQAVAKTASGKRRELLNSFYKKVAGNSAASLPTEGSKPGPGGGDKSGLEGKAKVLLPTQLYNVLQRKGGPEDKWLGLELLSKGEYQAAHDAIKPWLENPGDLAEKLFIYGKAQLALAEAKNDADLYRSAGLTFMRIVVHFTRAGQAHPLVAPARLEVAYIHKQIDRQDIYERLMFGGDSGAGVNLVIDDAEVYPNYRKRYYQIIGQEPPAADQP